MRKSIQELRAEQLKLRNDAKTMHDDESTDFTDGDTSQKYYGMMDAIQNLQAEIDAQQALIDSDIAAARAQGRIEETTGRSSDLQEAVRAATKSLFRAWAANGEKGVNAAFSKLPESIQNVMSTTTNSEGGFLTDEQFVANLLERLKAFGGVRQVADIMATADGNDMRWPTTDATAEVGELVAENTDSADEDADFGTVTVGAYKFGSKVVTVPIELLQDSRIDLEGHLQSRLTTRLGRITNQMYTTGTGTAQPEGVITAARAVAAPGGQTDSITYDDFINLEHAVDPAYRQSISANYMMHDSVLQAVRLLKDADGRPLWQPSLQQGTPALINGYSYVLNQNMQVLSTGTGEKVLAFGDFGRYLIRDAMTIELYRFTDSAFTRKGQVGFLAWMRSDGKWLDASDDAMVALQLA